ncbi:MAG: hypothetical protein OXU31_10390 [Gammaproteobacteria bacterium]|nr:hypothetical protein [Gammaproteobacteria bacterium]MDD9816355.1 hypothetical protein [Gammaproteobacteria bacterium]
MPAQLQRRKAFTSPRKWTAGEETRLLKMLRNGNCSLPKLRVAFPKRNDASIRSKVRKLRINNDLFGDSYREEKARFSDKIAAKVRPRTVFDAYAGAGHQSMVWAKYASTVYASEARPSQVRIFVTNATKKGFREKKPPAIFKHWRMFRRKGCGDILLYSGDATNAVVALRHHGVKINLLDLDTCGSAIPMLPIFLHLLRPAHLVITHGEFLSYRFGRVDVLRRTLCHRNINDSRVPRSTNALKKALIKADMLSALRSANETDKSLWLRKENEESFGSKAGGLLRVYYKVIKPPATADCLNYLAGW